MVGQQAQSDHHVGLAATHRLGELEHRLVGSSGESQQALSKELFHAARNETPGEALPAIPFIVDQIRQVLDALAHSVILDDGIETAGLFHRLDHAERSALRLLSLDPGMAMAFALQ